MKKAIKVLVFSLFGILIVGVIAGLIMHEPLPKGKKGPEAEKLAEKMLNAINKTAYDSLNVISWGFPGGHNFIWNKKQDSVQVNWGDYQVHLYTPDQTGRAFKDGNLLVEEESKEAINKAWQYFANDSFWLVAPYKINDPGTIRSIVDTEEGQGLLVTYSSGGVTPGDSYLWILDDSGLPKEWKLWVNIIPVGGISFSWEAWEEKHGAYFSSFHDGPGPADIELTEIKVKP